MVIRVAVVSEDEIYLKRLVDGLDKYQQFDLSVYSNLHNLEEISGKKGYDVLLFTADSVEQEQLAAVIPAKLKIILYDNLYPQSENLLNVKYIKKYQRISNIYKNILDLYSEVCGKMGVQEHTSSHMLAVYSPVGGAGKTTLALMTAMKCAGHGMRTFYISMEDMASEDCFLAQSGEKNLSDLMRYIHSDTNIAMKIQGMLKEKCANLYYIDHFSSPNDIYEMTVDDERALLYGLRDTGLFDVIVVDMGITLEQKNLALFDMADHIIIVEKTDELSLRKMNCFYAQYHIMQEYQAKMSRIINFDYGISEKVNCALPLLGRIGNVQNMSASNLIAVLANSTKNEFIMSVFDD